MAPTKVNIISITLNSDGSSVTINYTDQEDYEYTTSFPFADAPDKLSVNSKANYAYYETIIIGA